jgi:hypothetical protein
MGIPGFAVSDALSCLDGQDGSRAHTLPYDLAVLDGTQAAASSHWVEHDSD